MIVTSVWKSIACHCRGNCQNSVVGVIEGILLNASTLQQVAQFFLSVCRSQGSRCLQSRVIRQPSVMSLP